MPNVDVKISSMYPAGSAGGMRAYASATVDECLAIRGIKVIEGGRDGLLPCQVEKRKAVIKKYAFL